jgi:predicted GNAT family N-acyltransferase
MISIVVGTPAPGRAEPVWLERTRVMRARVLHEEGKRPQFRAGDSYVDPDTLDPLSYHVLGYVEDELVGCCRLFPVSRSEPGVTERLLGADRFEGIFGELLVSRAKCGEVGRWIVKPAHQRSGVGRKLLAATFAVARHLGLHEIVATVGTKDGQNRALVRIGVGAVPVPGVEPFYADPFSDRVVVMHASPHVKDPAFQALIDEMARTLDLES